MSDRYFAFISYAKEHGEWVAKLQKDLERCLDHYAGTVDPSISRRVFLDQVDLQAGRSWIDQFQEAVDQSDRLILVVSPEALVSEWVQVEWQSFFTKRPGDLFPVRIAEVELTTFLEPIQGIDFSGLEGVAYNERLRQFFGDLLRRKRRDPPPMPPELAPPAIAAPESSYTSDATRDLSQQLEAAYEERAQTRAEGGDPTALNKTILTLKRRLREGPQLEAGDFLLDGRFKLLETLGRGGFATVWKAYDRERQDLVAVKVLHSQYSKDTSRRDRFFRGARQMAGLRHPGIVTVVETECEDGGYHFFAMEYLAGGDFRQAVLDKRLSREERLRVILTIGEALSYAHSQGVIHRDVKPANILLDVEGRAKLTDFDLVRAADTTGGTRTAMMGTIVYAAPEAMLDGKQAAEPADVFGLGMTALFALHGRDLGVDVLYEPTPLIDSLPLSPRGRDVIRRSVARDIALRWSRVENLCAEMEAAELSRSLDSGTSHERDEPSRRIVVSTESARDEGSSRIHERLAFGHPDLPARSKAAQEKTGIELVYVPAGIYPIGEGESSRSVELDAFWIGKHPVTNEQYRRFVESGYPQPSSWNDKRFNAPNQPVTSVSWHDAMAFASWAGFALPSDQQWEVAARGPVALHFPWGNENPTSELADLDKNYLSDRPASVGSHPNGAGPFGAEDQAGGVWEWCADRLDGGKNRPLLGGSWGTPANLLKSTIRSKMAPDIRGLNIGFRVSCVQ